MVRILHPAPILAVFLVIAIDLFSRLFFYSVRNQAVTVLFFKKYQAIMSFYLICTSCRQTPAQDVAQCTHLKSGSSLLAEMKSKLRVLVTATSPTPSEVV